MENRKFDYGTFDDVRANTVKSFGAIFDLPIVLNSTEVALSHYVKGNVLDVGAGKMMPFKPVIENRLIEGKYFSLDNDPKGTFDFSKPEEVPSDLKFNLITANQFFEHLPYHAAIDFSYKLSLLLAKGGKLVVSVPNILHPNRYWGDITHLTHWNYNNLSLLYHYGALEVTDIARYSKKHPEGFFEKIIAKYISRIYRMDWCDSIVMVGVK